MNSADVLKTLKTLKPDLESRYKVKEISLFGSFVRGEQTDASDIDVLVDFAQDASFFDFMRLTLTLEETLHHQVDVVAKDALRSEIRDAVMRERVLV